MLLLFGLTSISSFILYFEIVTFKKLSNLTLIIVLLETFFSSLSMISRAMFFSCLPIYFSIYQFTRSIKKNFDISYFIKFFIIVICLFYISVVSVNFIRTKYFYIGLPLFNSEEFCWDYFISIFSFVAFFPLTIVVFCWFWVELSEENERIFYASNSSFVK